MGKPLFDREPKSNRPIADFCIFHNNGKTLELSEKYKRDFRKYENGDVLAWPAKDYPKGQLVYWDIIMPDFAVIKNVHKDHITLRNPDVKIDWSKQ